MINLILLEAWSKKKTNKKEHVEKMENPPSQMVANKIIIYKKRATKPFN